jgi:hypothetical protein
VPYSTGKRLDCSGRKDGNERATTWREGNGKEFINRKRALAEKVEGSYCTKEQEMFMEDPKQSAKNGALSETVRKLLGRGMDKENMCEEEEGLVVGDLGRRMVAQEWLIGEEPLVKEMRGTRGESTTIACGSKRSIGPALSQIQNISSSLDSAKCNVEDKTNTAWVHVCYKCVAQKVHPASMSDESVPGTGLDWRGDVIGYA